MDKQDLANLYCETALHINGFTRQEILNGVAGKFGHIPVYTDDLATYLHTNQSLPCTDQEFEQVFKLFIATQITDDEHNTIQSLNVTSPIFK